MTATASNGSSGKPERTDARQRLWLALGAFALAYGLSVLRIGHGAPDFYVFWAAARQWQAPYDPHIAVQLLAALHLKGIWPFVYPPTFLLFVRPFALLPLAIAYPLWTALSCGLFVFAAAHLVRPVWASALLVISPCVFFSAELGQTSLLIGAAAIGGFLMLERRPALAGVLFALAACVKPQAMILAPVVLWGRWRTLAAMVFVGAGVMAASLAFGPERWPEWLRALAAFRTLAPQTERINPSALVAAPWWSALCALLGLYLASRSRDLLGLIGGGLCLTPYAHAYDLAPLAPLAVAWLAAPRRTGYGLCGAGGALLAGVVATPAAALALFAGLAALRSPALQHLLAPLLAKSPAVAGEAVAR